MICQEVEIARLERHIEDLETRQGPNYQVVGELEKQVGMLTKDHKTPKYILLDSIYIH